MNVNSKEGSDGPLDHGWDNPGYDIDKYLTRLTNEVLPSPDNFEEPIDKRDDAPSSRWVSPLESLAQNICWQTNAGRVDGREGGGEEGEGAGGGHPEGEGDQVRVDGRSPAEVPAQHLGDDVVPPSDLGGGAGGYLAGSAGDHPV